MNLLFLRISRNDETMPRTYSDFTPTERAVLRIAQKNIPDTLTPFSDMAQEAGCTEREVLNLLLELKDSGAIRRFGASIKHQRAGFAHNAMVAWKVKGREEADRAGAIAATHPLISHCYYRPSCAPDWPYALFTMIHGRHETEYMDVIDFIMQNTCLHDYAVLHSLQELKKISMTYF